MIAVGSGAAFVGLPEILALLVPGALLYAGSRWCRRQVERAGAPHPRAT